MASRAEIDLAASGADLESLLDPRRPVVPPPAPGARPPKQGGGRTQTHRRAVILAAIRQLLVEEGYKGVTVRRIAELSQYVVQTVYNLVGPRDQAIVEAISDYTSFVGSLAPTDPEDPAAMIKNIDWQVRSVELAPEFSRQVCLIYFTPDRRIFVQYRERQARNIQSLLVRQKRSGILRRDVNCRRLAQDLLLYSGANYVEWADSAYPVEMLRERLVSGYSYLLAGAISPRYGGLAAIPF